MARSAPRHQIFQAPQGVPAGALTNATPLHQARLAAKMVVRGRRYKKRDDLQKAAEYFFKAFECDPRNLEALKELATCLNKIGRRNLAIQVFEKALEVNDNDPDVVLALGNMALDMQMPEVALQFFRILATLMPQDPVSYNNIATALRELERFDEAVDVLQNMVPLFPESAALWNTLATTVNMRDGLDASLPFYEEALKLDPQMVSTRSNLARAYSLLGRWQEVIPIAEESIRTNPEFIEAHVILGTALLATGDLERGWQEYEWRDHQGRRDTMRFTHGLPRWEGGELTDKHILVIAEQGIGDEILFAGCLPDLMARAKKITIACDPRLTELFERSFPGVKAGSYRDHFIDGIRHRHIPWLEDSAPCDCFIQIGSLGQYYRNDIASFPDRLGYLTPDPARVEHWRARLDALGPGKNVGICWRSGRKSHERNIHYTTLDMWGPIFAVKGVNFINLQYDDCATDLATVKDLFGVTLHDWDDHDLRLDIEGNTALTSALDLVIAPATAPGMTAVGTGTEWWCIAQIKPWWCFGTAHTPIHPKCSVLVTPEAGRDHWELLIREVAARLESLG